VNENLFVKSNNGCLSVLTAVPFHSDEDDEIDSGTEDGTEEFVFYRPPEVVT